MNHLAVSNGLKDDIGYILWDWTKQVGTGDNDLCTHTQHQVSGDRQAALLALEEGVDQVKMFDHNTLAFVERCHDCACNFRALGKSLLKPDIQMVGVRGGKQRKTALVDSHAQRVVQHLQNRQRTDIDTFIVICQLQPWKHTLNQHTLA